MTTVVIMLSWRCVIYVGILACQLVLRAADSATATDVVDCCEMAPQSRHECKQACQQFVASQTTTFSAVGLPVDSKNAASNSGREISSRTGPDLNRVLTSCPRTLTIFWTCINSSLSARMSADWWGQSCCEMSLTSQCRNACRRAKSRDDLNGVCTDNDERAVFVCLDRHERGQLCCQLSTSGPHCGAACKAIFMKDTRPTRSQLAAVDSHCPHQVATCLRNYSSSASLSNPVDSLPCCDQASNPTCRQRCQTALSSLSTEEQIVEELSQYCGVPDPSVSLWQCFLQSSTNNVRHMYDHGRNMGVTGIDSVMLQCCAKANTVRCRDLCQRTYSRDWTETAQDFHRQCIGYQPHETNLHACIQDVDERCQIGCKGLDYCSNFNHRPSEMFRSCTKQSDESARNAVRLWEMGTISLPMLMPDDILVKDIRTCQPRKWRAVACTLHVKPCRSNARPTSICRTDCLSLLNECLSPRSTVSAEEICAKLSPVDDPASCISISSYTTSSQHQSHYKDVTSPCNPNPCNASQVCEVIRRHCASRHTCPNYVCRPGCPMGEVVTQIVPHNAYVRIPKSPSSSPGGTIRGPCYQMCRCGRNGRLQQCNNMRCIQQEQCLLKSPMIYDHGTKFNMSCNRCICFESETLCTTRYCVSSRASAAELAKYTGLPCNCPAEYTPVCAINGHTYPNVCVARCNHLTSSQVVPGSCMKDPCVLNACSASERCVPYHQVCLGHKLKAGECRQYKCVSRGAICDRQTMSEGPVCDVHNNQLPSICRLFQQQRELAYHGYCKAGCQITEKVCGVDGNTYRSECSAWSAGVPVDYIGPCHAVAQLRSFQSQVWSCVNVTCPSRATVSNCLPITPPGACCPLCAGEIRVLTSPMLISEVIQVGQKGPITISDVLDVLRLQISVVECDIFAYPSVESELVILIMPITQSPTSLQVEACMTETEKLAALISSGSPVVTTFVPVSVFVSAEVRTVKRLRTGYGSGVDWFHAHSVIYGHKTLWWSCCIALMSYIVIRPV